jgi:decaprenylphospho-beta-D-ribofuranose 2-oxidase
MTAIPHVTQRLSGWGAWPREDCRVYRPEAQRNLAQLLDSGQEPHYIARGLGRSYGDPAVNPGGGVISFLRLDRMVDFDDDTGVLTCESGVSLADILECFLPRGWFLPVTPGTKIVTVGGAIANDVHGKNHHREGSFSEFVLDFELLTPTGVSLTCSREENPDVFWATVGGVGLTGFLITARIRLLPVRSAYIRADYYRAKNIHDVLAAIDETDAKYRYSVAWVDCLAKGSKLGRSVLMCGDHADPSDLSSAVADPLRPPRKRERVVPLDLPAFVLNPLSIGAFNSLFYSTHPSADGKIVDYDTYFYPLDSVHHWNRIYGKQGFTQYQVTLPLESVEGLIELLERLSQSSRASFLAVLKKFGPGGQGLLSHPIPGYTLTLDLPMRRGLVEFLHELDELVVKWGGRLYLAKDVCTKPEMLRDMYPRLAEFEAVRKRLDPEGKLSSRLARRLGLDGNGGEGAE